MPYRKIPLVNGEIYHVFNRSIAQIPIYLSFKEFSRFIELINFYRYSSLSLCFSHFERLCREEKEVFIDNLQKNSDRLVDIFAYCLIPNHFHLLLKQLANNGISTLMSNLQNGYAKYFNLRHQRQGSVFQSMFKATRIETEEQFLHVSRYIHLNPCTSFIVEKEKLPFYEWSSLPNYLGKRKSLLVNTKFILDMTGGADKYWKYIIDQADYQRKLGEIKHLTLENP